MMLSEESLRRDREWREERRKEDLKWQAEQAKAERDWRADQAKTQQGWHDENIGRSKIHMRTILLAAAIGAVLGGGLNILDRHLTPQAPPVVNVEQRPPNPPNVIVHPPAIAIDPTIALPGRLTKPPAQTHRPVIGATSDANAE